MQVDVKYNVNLTYSIYSISFIHYV